MGFEETLHSIEDKWQEQWQEEEVFQADPDDRDKFFITVAYPYPSGGMHLGHVRTYTLPDVFARFKRMQGKNVLFPMAWHVTGTPIIGAVNRLKNNEEKQIKTLTETYNIPREDLEDLETPMGYARYFIEDYRDNMKSLGFGVDWRREFTTNDEHYNRFIEWQYRSLKEKGLVKKGKHPTKYCLNDENPVTTHDLLEGEDAEKQEYTLVKFQDDDGRVLPMATLRPETVFGVTHVLVDPDGDYVEAKVDGERWIVADAVIDKLRHQSHDVVIQDDFEGEDLIGQRVRNPVNGDRVLTLPADFVDTGSGSGLVMSVPAHAPYDWISLQDLKDNADELEEYGVDPDQVRQIEPISIIDVEGYGDYPAEEACEEHRVSTQDDTERLEEATEEIYKKEHHTGILKSNCQEFAGDKINAVKDRLIDLYGNQGKFATLWDFNEDVVCRCGGQVIVAQSDTWFLEYGDAGWKDKADKALNDIRTVPEGTREDYEHAINWLESWPCIRNFGLGTQLPFDEDFVVEPLSDSTIYMAFYTIRHLIQDIDPEKLTQEFFDFVFLGQGPIEDVAETTGIAEDKLKEVRQSFDYWYPLDWRTSANELIQNHLTFFIFHHAALFNEQHWPDGIATWGMVLLEGKKMSSSKGHVVLPGEIIEDYGADTARFFMFSSCEPWQDFDWRSEGVKEAKQKLARFYDRTLDLYDTGEERELTNIDRYVLSRLNSIIREAEDALEDLQTRKASINIFFELNNVIRWYQQRADSLNREVVNTVLDAQIRMMAPFIPHICEELWDETGHDGFVSTAEWPSVDDGLIDETVEYGEELLKQTIDDTQEIIDLVGDYDGIQIALALDWKREAVRVIKDEFEDAGNIDIGDTMDRLTSREDLREHADKLADMVQEYKQNPGQLPDTVLDIAEERDIFREAEDFIGKKFRADIEIVPEDVSSHGKADRALPGKPAIILE